VKLGPEDIKARLANLPLWAQRGDGIVRQFTFKTFPDAIGFVIRLAFWAESKDHHPDMLVSFRHVTVTWSTHSAGGLTEKDFEGARQSDMMAEP
jgi:4a-hydroxytetrahydrobiopterin dehydratase